MVHRVFWGFRVRTARMIPALTGLRGYAALWVVFSHFFYTDALWRAFGHRVDWGRADGVIRHEYLAVDFFFMLSGFVLAHVHAQDFSYGIGGRTITRFLLLRLARIYPLHLFALCLMLALQLVDSGGTPFTFITHLLLVASWGVNGNTSWNLPAWSLSAEWLGYLLFPLIVFFTTRIRQQGWQLISVAMLFGLFYYLIFCLPININYSNGTGATIRVLIGVTIGCLLRNMYDTTSIPSQAWAYLFWISMPLALSTMTDWSGARLNDNVWAVVMMAVILLAASRAQGKFMLPFTHQVAVYLGEISYAIYILHYPVLRIFRWVGSEYYARIAENGSMFEVYSLVAVSILLLLVICAIAHELIEKPVRQWAQLHINRRWAIAVG